MQRHRYDKVGSKIIRLCSSPSAEELAERFCQAELVAVFQFVNSLFEAALVNAGGVDNCEMMEAVSGRCRRDGLKWHSGKVEHNNCNAPGSWVAWLPGSSDRGLRLSSPADSNCPQSRQAGGRSRSSSPPVPGENVPTWISPPVISKIHNKGQSARQKMSGLISSECHPENPEESLLAYKIFSCHFHRHGEAHQVEYRGCYVGENARLQMAWRLSGSTRINGTRLAVCAVCGEPFASTIFSQLP